MFKVIEGHERYCVSEDGKVMNRFKGTFLNGCVEKGYVQIKLGRSYRTPIHRLIAETFIPNPDNKPEVDHIDRNPRNNIVSNLRWATREENTQNRGTPINNTSGYKNIRRVDNSWLFTKCVNKVITRKSFKKKVDCICYKYIFNLKQSVKRI